MRRPDSSAWLDAKTAGNAAELAIGEWFHKQGYSVFQAVGRTEPDLKVETTVEVKHDRMVAQTGNLAIELSYKGRPSGLHATTAVWWAIVVGPRAYLCRVAQLKRWLGQQNYRTVQAGDGRHSLCQLVPVADFAVQPWVKTLAVGGATDAA